MRVVFLHIPKTAGQSVHAALASCFGEENICPARVNEQLLTYSISRLSGYKVFSGHLDWSLLDCVAEPVYRFTILRYPMDRILSFYFYLRGKAEKMESSELSIPQNRGLRAALEMSPDEYFCSTDNGMRQFLDNHYDNFYTYYFAARRYSGRGELSGLVKRGEVDERKIMDMALDNMSILDDVFVLSRMDEVFSKIAELSGKGQVVGKDYRVNVNNDVRAQERVEKLKDLGASEKTMARLEEYCRMDNEIWEKYSQSM